MEPRTDPEDEPLSRGSKSRRRSRADVEVADAVVVVAVALFFLLDNVVVGDLDLVLDFAAGLDREWEWDSEGERDRDRDREEDLEAELYGDSDLEINRWRRWL